MELAGLGKDVEWPDHEAATVVREHFAGRSGYGRLAELAEWVASVRPAGRPAAFGRIRGTVLGGSYVDAYADTAESVGATLTSWPDLPTEVRDAFDAGVQHVDTELDSGADLLLLALPGLAADAVIAAAVLTNTEPVKVLSRGRAATDPQKWMDLAVEVRDARRRCMSLRDKPDELLDAIGSARLAVAAGICMRASVRRTPVLLDGPSAAVGALVAYEGAPRAVRWWRAADLGPDPVHELALTRLGQQAILGLDTALGDGLAALLAIPALQAAARLTEIGDGSG